MHLGGLLVMDFQSKGPNKLLPALLEGNHAQDWISQMVYVSASDDMYC